MYDEGRFRVRIVDQQFGENKKGNPELQLIAQPIGYYNQGDEEFTPAYFQWPRTIFLTLTEGTLGTPDNPGWVMQTLKFLGFSGTSFSALDPNADNAHKFAGLEVDALCKHDEYDGKTREKWSILKPGGSRPQIGKIEKKSVRQLDAKFGKVLKAVATEAPVAVMAAEPAGDSEEIPF